MNKTILIILASLIAGGGLIFWSYTATKTQNPQVNQESQAVLLTASEPVYDFGEVRMAKGLVEHKFVLKNDSAEAVKIGRVETSCMCTTVFLSGENGGEIGPFGMAGHSDVRTSAGMTINPGEELIVRAVFDPAAHGPAGVGLVERQIALEVGGTPTILSFTATVAP